MTPTRSAPGRFPTDDEIRAAFEAYALAVGKVAHAWNFLHERFGRLFVIVSGAERHIALAIWYSTENDRAQQGMLKAAIFAGGDRWRAERPVAKDDLIWLMDEANSLADYRNTAVHMPASLYMGATASGDTAEMGPAFWQGHRRARRFIGKRLLDEFNWCERWAETLSQFAEKMESSLSSASYPWPDRPGRPTREPKKNRQDQPRRPRIRSRPRRLQSSPE